MLSLRHTEKLELCYKTENELLAAGNINYLEILYQKEHPPGLTRSLLSAS
jgi:hypothetical protein